MAAIFNPLRSFSGRNFSRFLISFSLPVNHLVSPGASKTISLKSIECDKLFMAVVNKSKSSFIKALLASRHLQRPSNFCVVSQQIFTSSVIISCFCFRSLQVISVQACCSSRDSTALSNSHLSRLRVAHIRLSCSL